MQMDFSSCFTYQPDLFAYIPQITIPGYVFNCFACKIDSFTDQTDLIGWKEDKENTYKSYSLLEEIPESFGFVYDEKKPVFSIAKFWNRFEP